MYALREIKKHVSDYHHALMITLFELIIPLFGIFERSVADGVRFDFIRTEKPTTHMIMKWYTVEQRFFISTES